MGYVGNTIKEYALQDTLIPIYIILQYDGVNTLKFPINPESLKKERGSEGKSSNIVGLGEVNNPKTPNLATISISSFFWNRMKSNDNYLTFDYLPSMYVSWLEKWQDSKKPAKLLVTRFNYSMEVTCEGFNHWINAGEEDTIYFELQLKEYKEHSARKWNVSKDFNLINKIKNLKQYEVNPIMVEIPRFSRSKINKPLIKSPYKTVKDETLLSITKKITGSTDDWKSLYDENAETFGKIVETSEIPSGTELNLPSSWIENENYNIVEV